MKIFFIILFTMILNFLSIVLFKPILFNSDMLVFNTNSSFVELIISNNLLFQKIKLLYLFSFFVNSVLFSFFIVSIFFKGSKKKEKFYNHQGLSLLIGKTQDGTKLFIPEKSLYQNMLVTGSIGSGKTASAMYPFTKQLLKYNYYNHEHKLGFLILDVKGNYYNQVSEFANDFGRSEDIVVIEIGGKYKYNPLNKPNLKASVLANRLKTILLLFSPNNSESYFLDKAEQVLEACITFCRVYNDGYVNFEELHKLVTDYDYFNSQAAKVRKLFLQNKFSETTIFNLYSSINFLKNDYYSLDDRNHNLLKSEITRITNGFVSDYQVKHTFCPSIDEENFYGFEDAIENGKIVILNMNISEYKNISKIIAAYLKLDFQTDVLKQLSKNSSPKRPMVFISDEYQEYVTSSDADFFATSREAKCINIVSTQSYTSILNSLANQNAAKVIIQNLVNKLWFRTDDIYTIEDIQKQIGKVDKLKFSKSFSENANQSNYNYISKNFITYNSNISESLNSYYHFDFIYDYNFFTQKLSTFNCLAFLSDGNSIIKPQQLKMIPYFENKWR